MATTSNTFTGDGSTTNYSFTFEYLEQDEVKVTLDGTASTAFTFANATTLSFTSAPANGVEIRIYRDTDTDTLKATFFPGSAVKAEDLNDNFTQNNFAVQEIKAATWDTETETIKSNETWVSSDSQIATTAAMDARFQDEAAETITSTETWPSDDNTIATTAAIDGRIDTAITNDIAGSDGVSITDDGDGTITVGLTDNAVDLDKIKDEDKITYAEQNAGSPSPADNNIFTASAAARRFDTIVQTTTPTGSDWEVGKTWLQNDADKTLSVWDGNSWEGISSGGTFTSQLQVVYVDAASGNDANDGHRISRPKATIKAAINQINADATYGDGSVVVVAAGVYQEVAPIQIQKKNVSIIGTALRSCIVHPTVATQGDHADGNHALFELNSGSFIQNLTLTGMKASNTGTNTLDSDLPARQGWNFAFYSGATITKSPYIQNCTNFSDSEIDNSNLNATNPAGGAAGDTDSAPTGGGMLVDGSVVDSNSPLRSMVADSYTHVGLNGPGILVTNNGYTQATSSYAFFNKYHIKVLNGGQANLAASTTDFGDYALVADGKSTSAIFTSNVDGAASDQATTFNINAPTAASGWHGTATRPQDNMLVEVNSVIYPVVSATANTDSEGGAGWTVTISRPDPNDRTGNLGLNGAVSDDAAVSFYLRSMIASSGHTMEYVGSGTDYRALPENGGVPIESRQITESNNGKVWAATTDHKGKFALGSFFTVDQNTGVITMETGSIQLDLGTLLVTGTGFAQLGAPLDMDGNEIADNQGDLQLNASGNIDVQTNKITNVGTPAASTDAATKGYVDTNTIGEVVDDASPQLGGNLDVNGNEIVSASNGDITINPNGTGDIVLDANVGIGSTAPTARLTATNNSGTGAINLADFTASSASQNPLVRIIGRNAADSGTTSVDFYKVYQSGFSIINNDTSSSNFTAFNVGASERMRIDSDGSVGIGTDNPVYDLEVVRDGEIYTIIRALNTSGITNAASILQLGSTDSDGSSNPRYVNHTSSHTGQYYQLIGSGITTSFYDFDTQIFRNNAGTERMRIGSNGVVTVKNGAVAEIDTLTSASTVTPDFAASCNFTLTLGHNVTLANPSNLTPGQSGSIFLVQDGTGSRTITFGSNWDFAGGSAPTISSAANAVDRLDYIVRSSTSIHAVVTLAYS